MSSAMLDQLPSIHLKMSLLSLVGMMHSIYNSKFSCFDWLFYYRLVGMYNSFNAVIAGAFSTIFLASCSFILSSYSLKSTGSCCSYESKLDKQARLPFLLLYKLGWFGFYGNSVWYQPCVLPWSSSLNSI